MPHSYDFSLFCDLNFRIYLQNLVHRFTNYLYFSFHCFPDGAVSLVFEKIFFAGEVNFNSFNTFQNIAQALSD